MRIGINAFPLRAEGGGARYVFAGLLASLLKLDHEHHYLIFCHLEALRLVYQVLKDHGGETLGGTGPDPRVKVIHILDETQIYGHRFEFDLLFGPLNNLQPRLYDRPTVAILHDIQEQYYPEYFSKSDLVARREVYPEICRATTTLVAISEFCKQTFIEKFNIDPSKIVVIPNAPQAELVHAPGDGYWSRESLPERFLFYPANTYKHKNHGLLLDAIEQLNRDGLRMPVVFSGFDLPGGFPLRKEIARRGFVAQCQVFTDLPPEELRYLFRNALAMVMPTHFEGFGMPVIEAAACGCPVVCSDLPVLREIVEDNALYFDPNSVDDACKQIRRVIDDPSLRQGLIERGFDIAAQFTWDRSATRMLQVFREARDRFVWSKHAPHSLKRPRIGVLIRMNGHGGDALVSTVESVLCTGYPDLVMQCEVPADLPEHTRRFLKSAGVKLIELPKKAGTGNGDSTELEKSDPPNETPARTGYDALEHFARQYHLDLVTELLEGNRFKISGLDSAAWGYLEAPEKPVHFGEAMAWRGQQFVDIARFRLTGDGLWKLEGYLFPEMMFIVPAALDAWQEGRQLVAGAGYEWRWELLRAAHASDRLLLTRRTIGDCDHNVIASHAQHSTAPAGMNEFHHVASNQVAKVRLLRYVEPSIKRAARVLPRKWQDAGTRLWYHLSR